MRPMIIASLLAASLAGCQSVTCYDNATCSQIAQERGGNSPSTLNPPISADVRNTDSPIAVNSGADQSRDAP